MESFIVSKFFPIVGEAQARLADMPVHMTKNEVRAIFRDLQMTQAEIADLLGVTLRTASNWATGIVPIPLAPAVLLRLLHSKKITKAQIRSASTLSPDYWGE
jgi:DNA-binding transcriptional regulator YiaG